MTITEVENILNNKKYTTDEKIKLIKNKNVSYSVLFELLKKYEYNNDIYVILNYLVRYDDDRFISKLNRKKSKLTNKNKQRRMHQIRRDTHGKHKRG